MNRSALLDYLRLRAKKQKEPDVSLGNDEWNYAGYNVALSLMSKETRDEFYSIVEIAGVLPEGNKVQDEFLDEASIIFDQYHVAAVDIFDEMIQKHFSRKKK